MPQRGPKATRVCWVSSARYSQPLNATEAQKWRLLAGLGGYDLRVIGFSDSIMPRRYQQGARFYLLPQLPGAPLRYLTFFALTPWLLLILMLRAGDSILVAQSPYEGAAAAWVKNVLGLLGRGPRLIIENHNNFEEDLFLQRRVRFQGLYRALMLGLARYAFGRGDALRVISSSTSERARHYAPGLPQARFMAFSDMRAFQGVRRAVPVERAQDIVYAGVLIPRKGVDLLLEAFARLNHPRARLHVIGEAANADYARSLRERAQKLGIADRVHFAGALPQASLAEYFASARVMALPSLSEGLGRVIVEAMLTGTPVIGSRVGGIPDLVRHGANGWLFAPGDVAALTDCLRQAYEADVATMGDCARRSAEAFWSPQRYREAYRQLFELVLEG